ncbi:EamA family transporter [Microbacterium sp.]|uniref:EamA family transporter n=1 Tax=Microbacterium sp. TaxID=51671 RepID=UPI003A90C3AE
MGVLLSLLAAICYGTSDFAAGIGGRRGDAGAVAIIAQPITLVAAVVAVLVVSPPAPTASALWWGAAAGVASGVGTLALYRGLATARMSVVAPLSGVLTAAIPVVVGALLGDRLPWLAWVGVGIAVPAALLVSLVPDDSGRARHSGVVEGVIAGVGFALLFIALAQTGTDAGAWPLVPTQAVSVVVVVAAAIPHARRPAREAWGPSLRPGLLTGVLGGAAALAYLSATGFGQLAVVAVITALYPAVTVLMARFIEHERWAPLQLVGLVAAVVAVVLIGIG